MRLPSQPRALVTGGASGLGRALCLELAARQAKIVVADIDLDGANETVRLVAERGGEAVAKRCDVAVLEDVEAAAVELESRWDRADLVINNAGVAVAGRTGEVPMEDWRWVTDINQWGVIHGCHAFVPRFVRAGRGWILNVASSAGFAAAPEMAPYNVTKAAVIALSETLYAELGPDSIAVSVLCPTFFPTAMLERFRSPTDRHKEITKKMFERSKTTAEEVARVALAGLEAGRLHIVPQADGRLVMLLKRMAPARYHKLLAGERARAWLNRLVGD